MKKLMKTTVVLLTLGAVLSAPSHATKRNFSNFFGKIREFLSNKRSKDKSNFVYDAKNIPTDIMMEVLPHLEAKDLVSFSQVDSGLQELAKIELAKAKLAFLVGDAKKIKKGTFIMGPSPGENPFGNEPRSFVTIEKDYWMMVDPVTQGQYKAVMGKDRNQSRYKGAKRPVTNLTRAQEAEYISKLNGQVRELWKVIHPQAEEGEETEASIPQFGKPTEAQWEFATTEPLIEPITEILEGRTVQITASHMVYSGTNSEADLSDYANYNRPWADGPSAVSQVKPNLRGIRGLSGGVWEVTSTPYSASGSDFVMRGGDWNYDASYCRSARRYDVRVDYSYGHIGLRLVTL